MTKASLQELPCRGLLLFAEKREETMTAAIRTLTQRMDNLEQGGVERKACRPA